MFGGGFPVSGGYGGYGGVAGAREGGVEIPASQGLAGFIPGDNAAGPASHDGAGAGKTPAQTLTPVTIRMLLEAAARRNSSPGGPDGTVSVSGRELQMLTVVACVEAVIPMEMSIKLLLDDGSGKMSCHMYTDSDSASGSLEFQAGDYIRVFGHLRQWEQQDQMSAHRIVKVESANEIAYHTIEVAHVHLNVTGKLIKSGGQAARAPAPASIQSQPMQVGYAARHAPGTSAQAAPQVQTPHFAAQTQSRPLPAVPPFNQNLSAPPASLHGAVPQMQAQANHSSAMFQQQSLHNPQQPTVQMHSSAQPQVQLGFGGVQGAAVQPRTSPFQGGTFQSPLQQSMPPPPGGSLYGGAGGNSLYGTAPGAMR